MYKIGVIGDYDSICGFSAMGFTIAPVTSTREAKEQLSTMVSGGYGIIYITEPHMKELEPEFAEQSQEAIPCIIPIPAHSGPTGLGEERLRNFVERAVGSDIIFGEQQDEDW